MFANAANFWRAKDFDCLFLCSDPYVDHWNATEHTDQSERAYGGDGGMHGGIVLHFVSVGDSDDCGVSRCRIGADLFEAAYI